MKQYIPTVAALLATICTFAQTASASQEQLASSIQQARIETVRTADQLKATLSALNALSRKSQGDLKGAYDAFAVEVPKTEAAAAWTKTRVEWMEGDGQRYFETWQASVNSIANASLRKKAQRRLDSVKASFQKVNKSLVTARDKFQPFLSDLSDIQKALANDVTPAGVKAVRSTVEEADWNHKFVSNAIQQALKEMKKMEEALGSEAK